MKNLVSGVRKATSSHLSWLILVLIACLAIVAASLKGDPPAIGNNSEEWLQENGTLMLVRKWDTTSGMLTGWLPNHNAAIQLEIVGKPVALQFSRNQAVTLHWHRLPATKSPTGQVMIAPAPREFEGRDWIPVKRDPNVVTIKKHAFLIREIIFGSLP